MKIFFISILILLHFGLYSQERKITITVIDLQDNSPIEFVAIYASGEGVLTDAQGNATLNLPKGKIELKASIVGYDNWIESILTDTIQGTFIIKMKKSISLLNEVSVVSGRYERKLITEVASVEIIKPNLLKSNNLSSMEQL
ncbi:MAG TPA: carboxypeptidase-like regulatory domain-containing protein, partial [Saprospiraceae bacterium]|nr:carboxypeptidase-like regulatory domain-containing protein [Saprospiraceae bacterium]